METTNTDALAELIKDCAAIPVHLRRAEPLLPTPRVAPQWTVSDSCQAQVHDLDEYL